MSSFAGVDLSSKAIDIVLLDEDGNRARHERRRLDLPSGGALARIRRVRDRMPARAEWRDQGVLEVCIEEPFARGNMRGQVPILMVIGAILQTIPPEIPLAIVRADDWRRVCDLPIRGTRETLKKAAIDFAGDHWPNHPAPLDDNMADGYCIAFACRELSR